MLASATYIQDYSVKKIPHTLGPFDKKGIPLFDPASIGLTGNTCYHPTVIMQYALACYCRREHDKKLEESFRNCARWLEQNTSEMRQTGMISWPIPFDLRVPRIEAPWYSSLTHAQGISVLLRYYSLEGKPDSRELLRKLAEPLVTTTDSGGFLYRGRENSFFEEAGTIHILNGCLTTLYGALELLELIPDERLKVACQSVAQTLEKWLPVFDTGYWSRYSLGLRFNLADMHYHQLHIRQLNELGFILSNQTFLEYSRKWNSYLQKDSNVIRYVLNRTITLNLGRALTVTGLGKLRYR